MFFNSAVHHIALFLLENLGPSGLEQAEVAS